MLQQLIIHAGSIDGKRRLVRFMRARAKDDDGYFVYNPPQAIYDADVYTTQRKV
jgi:hypothetical protein